MDLSLSAGEHKLLEAYDQLEQIRLESALLRAYQEQEIVPTSESSSKALEEQIKVAEREVLDAKAAYSIRNRVVEAVLTAEPTLKAVHSGEDRSEVEQRLATWINRRDELSQAHAKLCADLSSTNHEIMKTEVENAQVTKKNAELAQELFRLVEAKRASAELDVADPDMRSEIESLKDEVRSGRIKWRIMKSVVSAMIAGSGINWAQDDKLRELVMDDEEDDVDEPT